MSERSLVQIAVAVCIAFVFAWRYGIRFLCAQTQRADVERLRSHFRDRGAQVLSVTRTNNTSAIVWGSSIVREYAMTLKYPLGDLETRRVGVRAFLLIPGNLFGFDGAGWAQLDEGR